MIMLASAFAMAAAVPGAPPDGVLREIAARIEAAAPPPTEFSRSRPQTILAVEAGGLNYEQNLTLMCLQGLVNRRSPRLFCVGMNRFNLDADRHWLQRFQQEYGIAHETISYDDALAKFAGELQGCVVWDPDLPATLNIAAMVGAALDLLPVSPGQVERAVQAGLDPVFHLRNLWPDHLAAERWAAQHLLPHMSREHVGAIHVRGHILHLCRDLLVMHRAYTLDLSSAPLRPVERELRGRCLEHINDGGVVWGWVCLDGEPEHVRQASEHGLRVLCSTNSPNLSLFSRLEPKRALFSQPHEDLAHVAPEEKAYLSFVLSDGDSIPILLTRQWYWWADPQRGRVPFGWEIQPMLADLAPLVLEYYYDTMTPQDQFILGPSGSGYTHPSEMPNRDDFLRWSAEGARQTGALAVGINDAMELDTMRAWSAALPDSPGFLYGWAGSATKPVRIVGGKPHIHYTFLPRQPRKGEKKDAAYYEEFADQVIALAEQRGLPCVFPIHLSCYWSGPSDIPKIIEAIGDQLPVEVVKPERLLALARVVHADRLSVRLAQLAALMPQIGGRAVLHLDNTFARDIETTITCDPPAGVSVTPSKARAAVPAEGSVGIELRLSTTGADAPAELTVRLTKPEERTFRVPLIVAPPPEGKDLRGLTLQSLWPGTKCGRVGRAEPDPEAHDGEVWLSDPERDATDQAIVWGQYEEVPAGSYWAVWRLKSAAPGEGAIARLDVYNYYAAQAGRRGLAAQMVLNGEDLEPGKFRDIWVPFDHDGFGKLEYRIFWADGAPLALDRIVVLRRAE